MTQYGTAGSEVWAWGILFRSSCANETVFIRMSSRAPAEREKLEALASMDLVRIMRAYILAIVDAAQGYKALVVDKETMRIASTLCGRTELGEHGIVLVERLEATGKDHHELKVSASPAVRARLSKRASVSGRTSQSEMSPSSHAGHGFRPPHEGEHHAAQEGA